MRTQIAYNDERIFFRFNWAQPDPGGWLHDMLVYRDGSWERFAEPSPWVPRRSDEDHTGFYEDRVSFLLDDGSVEGFEQFGGWLTAHRGMRSLPSEVPPETVQNHDHFGSEGLDKTDIRKYIPQACAGEWWENDWETIRPQAELEQLKSDGVFLDLPMWRAHRSNPKGYGTDHHILDYRHSDQGQNTYTTQSWTPDDGPELMWDPAVVDGGALDYHEIRDGSIPDQQDGTYALELDDAVEYDPSVAEWEGAMIPRRPLQEPHGSAADWRATGTWADGEWTVEMWRDLQTGHPADTTQLESGEVYTWSPAIHHSAGKRWHWAGYPYKLGLGVEPEYSGSQYTEGTAELVASEFSGETPSWSSIETYTIPLVFPGILIWDDLVDANHPRAADVRDGTVTMWELYENDPETFLVAEEC
ncbi:cytochrome C-552/DMSO reductase-like, heme-binding domain-containing protein [Natrialba hulunbeirensis JCM 10989]|uniref:Cytochrome C-552/DMSO reductase-like, heme-binding domain-containing protein n=1 Tax=Natrialba hulunbeirensis JCM 10989 TaxID=1227493 RepID=M0A078_9EURY|nr:cytochrome C-552/DMSO reductase-like, heme-binding domain-containing protein [Natrialba hulunbeirensis JCM 10989]